MPGLSKTFLGVPIVEVIGAWVIAVVAAVISFLIYGATANDDVYITLSAARAFATNGLFSNLNGDPIEQSTTLLQVLMLTPFAAVLGPAQLPTAAWIIAIGFYVLTIVVSFVILRRCASRAVAFAGLVMVALVPSLSYWSMSGMEVSLTIFLVLCLILWADVMVTSGRASLQRVGVRDLAMVVLGAVLVLLTFAARPDVGLYSFAAVTVFFVFDSAVSRRWRVPLLWWGVSLLFLAGLTVVRRSFTGQILPQSVIAKSGRPWSVRLDEGWTYLTDSFGGLWFPAALMGLVFVALLRPPAIARHRLVLLLSFWVAALLGVIVSAGDWMPFGRFLVPLQVLTILLLLVSVVGLLPGQKVIVLSAVVVPMLFVSLHQVRTGNGSTLFDRWQLDADETYERWSAADTRFNRWSLIHHRDLLFPEQAMPPLRDYLGAESTATIGSRQAGMVAYYLREEFGDRFQFIDQWSLSTSDFNCDEASATRNGSLVDEELWLATAGDCSPPLPDFVFGIDRHFEELGDAYDVLVDIDTIFERESRRARPGGGWLVVRSDLVLP